MPDSSPTSPSSPDSDRPKIMLPYQSPWRRLVQRIPRREQILNTLRSLAWVFPLTLVIWIYAEREEIDTMPSVSFSFEVKSNNPDYVVTLHQDHNIEVDLTGPRSELDEVNRLLHPEGNGQAPITIVANPKGTGPLPLNTYDQIYNNPIFAVHGVSVIKDKVLPSVLSIDVDKVLEQDVAVKAPPGLKDLESATFEPATVRVKAPALAFTRAQEADGHVYVYAAIANLEAVKQPGAHVINVAAVSWPNPSEPNVSIAPDTVKANIVVKQADIEYEMPSPVPVYLLTPYGLLDQFHVAYSPTIKNVKVIGPADKIDQLKNDEDQQKVPVRATLTITNSDPIGAETSRTLHYDLPDGIRVSDDDAKRQVTFTLTARSTGP